MKRDPGWLGACVVTPRDLGFDCDCDWIADPCAQDCGCGVGVMVSDVVESVLGAAGAPSRTHALVETLDMSQSVDNQWRVGSVRSRPGRVLMRVESVLRDHTSKQKPTRPLNTGLSTQQIQSIIHIQILDSPRREVSGRLML